MAEGHKDYSGTPLWKKLGIRPGSRVVLVDAPEGFPDLLTAQAPLPGDVRFIARATKDVDVAVLFVTERRSMERRFGGLQRTLDPAGRLWVCWPKKASKVATDLTFGAVQQHGLSHRPRRQQDRVDHRRVPGVPIRRAAARSAAGTLTRCRACRSA